MSVPIVQTSAFGADDLEALISSPFQYTRVSNPTTAAWEQEVAALEGAELANGFASGMGAIAAVLLGELQAGDHIVAFEQVYGVTYALITQTLERFGITATFVDMLDLDAVRAAIQPATKLLYTETMSNPTLLMPQLDALARVAHERGCKLVVDNTFATPFLARPIASGADIVVHSATKFLNGHSDVSAGIVLGSAETIRRIQRTAWLLGSTLDPMASWLLLRGLKTLAIRMERQCATAARVADRLRKVASRVYYPGQGAIVSFEVSIRGDETRLAAAKRTIKALTHIPVVPSLGGCSTTITHPASTSHRAMPLEMRDRLGVGDGLLRLSIGLEDAETLCVELESGLCAS